MVCGRQCLVNFVINYFFYNNSHSGFFFQWCPFRFYFCFLNCIYIFFLLYPSCCRLLFNLLCWSVVILCGNTNSWGFSRSGCFFSTFGGLFWLIWYVWLDLWFRWVEWFILWVLIFRFFKFIFVFIFLNFNFSYNSFCPLNFINTNFLVR